MSQKVMMIGLDGATWKLLDVWISENELPTFRKLIDFGSRAILNSTIPSQTCPALPSMLTGMNPGNTGIFSLLKPDNSIATLQDFRYPTIWNILDKYNYSSCVVNVRFTFPPEKLNGLMICGYPIPSDKSNYTYPEEIREKIKGFRDDKIEKKILELRDKKKDKEHREELLKLSIEKMELRYKIFKKFNQEKDYDFSFFWIGETDTLQHCCWEYKDALLELYRRVDHILCDALSSFPSKNFLIVSDHGFESSPQKFFFVNAWLHREGYLKPSGGVLLHHFVSFAQLFAYRYVNSLRLRKALQFLQFGLRKHRGVHNPHLSMERVDNFPGIDKRNSAAYLATLFGIDINDSANYEKIREEIIGKMEELTDSGEERVIKDAWKKEEIYTGRYLKDLPDVIFLASEKYMPFPALTSNLFSEIKSNAPGERWGRWQSGYHSRARDGILIAYGPIFKRNEDFGSAKIEDVYPTVLHLLGCEIPTQVDGRVLTSVFEKNSDPAKRVPVFRDFHIDKELQEVARKDEEKMKERLRDLGYL